MSYIVKRRVKGSIYVYEATSYRNKQGKPRSRQRYLGKLDADGVLITKKRKLPKQIKEVKTVSKKFILEPYTASAKMSGSTGKANPVHDQAQKISPKPEPEGKCLYRQIFVPQVMNCAPSGSQLMYLSINLRHANCFGKKTIYLLDMSENPASRKSLLHSAGLSMIASSSNSQLTTTLRVSGFSMLCSIITSFPPGLSREYIL